MYATHPKTGERVFFPDESVQHAPPAHPWSSDLVEQHDRLLRRRPGGQKLAAAKRKLRGDGYEPPSRDGRHNLRNPKLFVRILWSRL